jgi:sugar lactone lactonase YvrE
MSKGYLWSAFALAIVSATGTAGAVTPPAGTIAPFTANLANTGCGSPEGIAADHRGNIYAASDADGMTVGSICVFNPGGKLSTILSIPAGPAGIVALLGMAFEGDHTLYALDLADGNAPNGRVLRIDTQTKAVTVLASGFAFPNAIAVKPGGDLFVSDSALGTINRISPDGARNAVWVADPLLATAGFPPVGANGVAFDSTAHYLYVANTGDSRILRVPVMRNGTAGSVQIFADGATINATQNTTEALHGADGIAFDTAGNLYVAANQANEIQVLSPNAHLIARYVSASSITLDFPASLVFRGSQLYFTNASLFDGGINSQVLVLQAPTPGLPLF